MFFTLGRIYTPVFVFYYYYFVIIFLLPFFISKYLFLPKKLLIFFIIIFAHAFINVAFLLNTTVLALKVGLSTFAIYLFYYFILRSKRFNLKYLFQIYLNGAYFVSVLGLFQVFAYSINFKYGYDYSWLGLDGVRSFGYHFGAIGDLYPVHSIYGEPAHFGCGIAAASFIAFKSLITNSYKYLSLHKCLVIIIAMLLSTSSTSYFAIFITFLLLFFSKPKLFNLIIIATFGTIVFYVLYNYNLKFKLRVDDFILLFKDNGSFNKFILTVNGSTRILINNTYIAIQNALDHPFGTGIGSHAVAYFKYTIIPRYHEDFGLNYNDANSLFNRILSEFGFVGIGMVIYFLIKFRVKTNNGFFWDMNSACLVMIFTFLLRQGHYFSYALPFFVLSYYLTNRLSLSN